MKIVIKKNVLNNILEMANLIINEDNINPVLTNILINASIDENKITCIFSNENISVKVDINEKIQVEKKGKVLIRAKILKGIISKLPNEDITLEQISNSLKIFNSTFDANVNLLDENMYLNINFNSNSNCEFQIKSDIINEAYRKTNHCLANATDKNLIINGICIDSINDEQLINFITTDSYRIALYKKHFVGPKFKIVVDINLLIFITHFSKLNENILFNIDQNKIYIKWDNIVIIAKIMLGTYPNVYNIFNSQNTQTSEFVVNAKQLFNVIDRGMYLVNNDKTPTTSISINQNFLEATFKSIEIGSSSEKIPIESINIEENIKFIINARFLNSSLKAFDDHDVKLIYTGVNKPIIIADLKEKDFIQLILPMRSY